MTKKPLKHILRAALFAGVAAAFCPALGAQVLDSQQVKNTAWTGFGIPYDRTIAWYGMTDYFQARLDLGTRFTMEGMLNVGLLADYDNNKINTYKFGTTNLNPLAAHYSTKTDSSIKPIAEESDNNDIKRANLLTDAFYVNFFYHINENFDVAAGTKLNWKVGPAPDNGDDVWAPGAHVAQGGFSTAYEGGRAGFLSGLSDDSKGSYVFTPDKPGDADVVGFVPYANSYAKSAAAIRFVTKENVYFEGGIAFPAASITNPAINIGLRFAPLNWLSVSAVAEGINFSKSGTNFYFGATIGDDFIVGDIYLALDNLITGKYDDSAFAVGAAATFKVPKTEITLKPEVGVNWFENTNYTPAWYFGVGFNWSIARMIDFNAYGSAAFGSRDRTWWLDKRGGYILTLRPALKFFISSKMSFDFYVNGEIREAFDRTLRGALSSGVFFTLKIL